MYAKYGDVVELAEALDLKCREYMPRHGKSAPPAESRIRLLFLRGAALNAPLPPRRAPGAPVPKTGVPGVYVRCFYRLPGFRLDGAYTRAMIKFPITICTYTTPAVAG